jgi:hypothetical protein
MKKCSVTAAYEDRRGRWETIEDLAEEALLPPDEKEVASFDG